MRRASLATPGTAPPPPGHPAASRTQPEHRGIPARPSGWDATRRPRALRLHGRAAPAISPRRPTPSDLRPPRTCSRRDPSRSREPPEDRARAPPPCPVPRRNHVADAEAKAVPVGKAPGRVVAEAGVGHATRRYTGAHAQEMLSHAEHGLLAESREPAALLGEHVVMLARDEAAVEVDLTAMLAQLAQGCGGSRSLREIGEIAGAHGSERGRATQHEPG